LNLQLSGMVSEKQDDMIDNLDWQSAEEIINQEQEQ